MLMGRTKEYRALFLPVGQPLEVQGDGTHAVLAQFLRALAQRDDPRWTVGSLRV